MSSLPKFTSLAYDRRYYEEHKAAGLDYLTYGGWQREYGRWIVQGLDLAGRVVLDVGCACGGIAKGIEDAGAFCCVGVDLDEHMIALGREHLPPPVPRLHVCDAVNLHLFRDGTFDALHSAQVAEHWRPDLVPLILRELARVARPGALFFCCLDTTELFERGSPNEDPTHICVQTKAWWREQLADAGWRDRTAELNPPLEAARAQSDSLKAHDWEYFVCEKS